MLSGMVRTELADIGKKSRTGDPSAPKSIAAIKAEVSRRMTDKLGASAPAEVESAVLELTESLLSTHLRC